MMKGMIFLIASLVWSCLVGVSILLGFTVFKKDVSSDDMFTSTSSTPGACLEKMVDPEWRPFGGPFPYYSYTTKKKDSKSGKWVCPEGYFDTGCRPNHGSSVGKLQCRKIDLNSPGLWKSPQYGGAGGSGMTEYRCGPGEIVSHVVGFYGQNKDSNTNAFTAFCKKPGEEKIKPIMNKATCGKRNYPDASEGLADFFRSFASLINLDPFNIYSGAWGRKLYKFEFASSERGFDSWGVKVKDNEIHGLRLRSRDQTQLEAGGKDPNSTYKEYAGQCPSGKVLIGFRASCGNRVDRIQMICDAENHTNSRTLKTS